MSVIGSKDVRNNSGGPFSECFIDNISLGLMQQTQGPADNNIPLCLQYGLVDGPHILTLNVTVFKGQAFWFDRIEYAPSASVALNNESIFIFGTDPALEYGTGWELDKESLANFTQTSKSTFAFSFIGALDPILSSFRVVDYEPNTLIPDRCLFQLVRCHSISIS